MFRKNNTVFFSSVVAMVLLIAVSMPAMAQQPKVRIEMERETREEVKIAIPEFVLDEGSKDLEGLGKEARKILENDLRISELFISVPPRVYEDLMRVERGKDKVDYWSWHQVGAQWLVKTGYKVESGKKAITFTFRLFDTVNERFLIGKRYTANPKFLRKIIHRFSDEVVMQLTGKRGVAETRIIFISDHDGFQEIYGVDFDGHGQSRLTNDKTLNLTPSWSDDGRWIIYTSYSTNNPDLVMIDSMGIKPKRTILRLPGLNAAPSWSPVARKIALVLSKDENSEIYVLNDNRKLNRLTRHFNIDTSPTWSPDGKKIAFTSDRSGTGSPQIYIMDAVQGDKGKVQRITFGSSYNDNPAWSPDGDRIAYTSRVGRSFQIKIYDLNTKKNFQLTHSPGSNEQPSWSPDGQFIVYRHRENDEKHIYVKRVGSKKTRQLSFLPNGGSSPAWSPYLIR